MAWTIGWKETRTDGYTTYYEPLDGDLNDVVLDDMEPEYGRRIFPDARLKYGRRVVREGLPRKIQFNGKNRTIPEVGDCYTHIFVSRRFREIAEEFEPEVHQFIPVEVLYKDGRHGADRFWLNVCQRLATIHPTKSVPPLTSTVWGPGGGSIPNPKIVFDKVKIGGHHMWVDKNLQDAPAVVSNALGERLAQSGIFGLSIVQREEA